MTLVIRWERDAAAIPAACALAFVLIAGGALVRLSVKHAVSERRSAAAAVADSVAEELVRVSARSTLETCGRPTAPGAAAPLSTKDARVGVAGWDHELACRLVGEGQAPVMVQSAGQNLADPVRRQFPAGQAVWTIAVAPQEGWTPWRQVAVHGLLVLVMALFGALIIAELAGRPAQLRRELRARDRRLKAAHQRLAEEIHRRETLESGISQARLAQAAGAVTRQGHFIDRVTTAQQRARRYRPDSVAVFVISLDRITPILDERWRSAGEDLLLQAASRLERCVGGRESAVARIGDGNLGVLLGGLPSRDSATAEAYQFQRALAAAFSLAGQHVYLKPTIGLALGAAGDTRAEQLLHAAQLALERAIDSNSSMAVYSSGDGVQRRARHHAPVDGPAAHSHTRTDLFSSLPTPAAPR